MELNGCTNVTVRPEAVSDKTGTATFFETGADGSNANSLAKQEKHSQGVTVATVSVDDITDDQGLFVNLLKVDVEGAEYALLKGAERTITRCRPAIFLSLHPEAVEKTGASMTGIWEILQQYNFNVSHLGKPAEKDWFVRQTGLFDVVCLSN